MYDVVLAGVITPLPKQQCDIVNHIKPKARGKLNTTTKKSGALKRLQSESTRLRTWFCIARYRHSWSLVEAYIHI